MNTYPIVTYPTGSLKEKSFDVDLNTIATKDFQDYLDRMVKTMEVEDGIGLASPQIGLNKRVIVCKFGRKTEILLNPKIVKFYDTKIDTEEGCLSIPGVFGIVTRPKRVILEGFNRHGRRVQHDLKKMNAVVAQHEIDHLDGILFIDKMHKLTKGNLDK